MSISLALYLVVLDLVSISVTRPNILGFLDLVPIFISTTISCPTSPLRPSARSLHNTAPLPARPRTPGTAHNRALSHEIAALTGYLGRL